jgi:hypothetical protein
VLLKTPPERRFKRLIVSDSLGVAVIRLLLKQVGTALVIQFSIRDVTPNMMNGLGGAVEAEPPIPVFSRVKVGVGKAFDGIEQAAAHRKPVKLQDSGERYVAGLGVDATALHRGPVPNDVGSIHATIFVDGR